MNLDSQTGNAGPARQLLPMRGELACPVCRAKQSPQTECRRCGADLSLYIKALLSVAKAGSQLDLARQCGNDIQESQVLDYLKWLNPKQL